MINTRTEDLRARVFELTDNKGADAVFDIVGGAMFEPALRCLRVGGRQIAITSTGANGACVLILLISITTSQDWSASTR